MHVALRIDSSSLAALRETRSSIAAGFDRIGKMLRLVDQFTGFVPASRSAGIDPKRPVDTTNVASFKMVPGPNVQPVAFTFLARRASGDSRFSSNFCPIGSTTQKTAP